MYGGWLHSPLRFQFVDDDRVVVVKVVSFDVDKLVPDGFLLGVLAVVGVDEDDEVVARYGNSGPTDAAWQIEGADEYLIHGNLTFRARPR